MPLPLPRRPRAALPLADLWIVARARQSRASRISRFIPPVCACVPALWTGLSLYELVRGACVSVSVCACLPLRLPQYNTVSTYFYILFFLYDGVVNLFRVICLQSVFCGRVGSRPRTIQRRRIKKIVTTALGPTHHTN